MQQIEEFREDKQLFIDWLAMPYKSRQVKTLTEFSNILGYDRTTLWRWKKDPDLIKAVMERKRELTGVEHLPDVIDAIAERAKGDGKEANEAAELLLEYIGEYSRKGNAINIQNIQKGNGDSDVRWLEDDPEAQEAAESLIKSRAKQVLKSSSQE